MDKDDISVGMVGSPVCGDVMHLQIKVNEHGVIEYAKFKTYGCGSAIASSSLLTEWVKGKTLEEAGAIKNTEIAEELALPPVKILAACWQNLRLKQRKQRLKIFSFPNVIWERRRDASRVIEGVAFYPLSIENT